jgi:hypothetical protein
MILTDEEIEKCRELAFHAAKKSQQSCKGQQVTPSDDYEYQFAWAIEAAILAKLNSAEPVGYEFQSTDGKWCQFIDQRHFDNTKADGRWLIRAIYTTPQPDRTAELAPSPAPHSGRLSPVGVPASTASD